MINPKFMLRILALLALSFWAQGAAAVTCTAVQGVSAVQPAAEIFANAGTKTCGSTSYAVLPTTRGHTVISSYGTITVQFVNGGYFFSPVSSSLSCTGATSIVNHGTYINAVFSPTLQFTTSCDLSYTDATGQTVSHLFYAGAKSQGTALIGFIYPFGVGNGWFEELRPTVTLAGVTSAGGMAVTASFSENITAIAPSDFTLTNATISPITVVSPSKYTFNITPIATGSFSVVLPANSVTDLALNGNVASNTLSGTADLTPPTATLSSTATYVGISAATTVIAEFGEAVTGFTAADISTSNLRIYSVTQLTPARYKILILATGNGAASLQIGATKVQDLAGNANTASNILNFTADTIRPTPVLSGLPATVYTGIPKTITITFNEPVTGFSLLNVRGVGAALSNFIKVDASTYTVDLTPSGAATVSIGIVDYGASLIDLAHNTYSSTGVVPIRATNAGAATPIAASFTPASSFGTALSYSVAFADRSTPTSGETLTSWAWDFGDGSTSTAQNPSHSYTGNGTFTVSLQACDPIGCNTATGTVTVNTALGTLSAALSGMSGTINGPQTLTLVFSGTLQPPIATDAGLIGGLTLADFTANNLTLSNLVEVSSGPLPTDPDIWTLTATPIASGAVSIFLPANVVTNTAAVGNAASNVLNATADLTAPTVVLSGLPANIYATPQTITATFNEDVTGFSLSAADIASTGLALSNLVVVSPTIYRFDAVATATGAVSLKINAGAVTDIVGNAGVASNLLSATALGAATPIAASFSISANIGTALPHSVTFTDTSTPTSGETLTSWAWDFGDGSTSTVQNPVHSYTGNGTFTVSLQACDAIGCSTAANGTVTVSDALGTLNATLSGLSGLINGAQTITLTVDSQLDPGALGGLTLTDFATTNLTLSNLVQTSAGAAITDPQTYTFTATPIADGAVSLGLPAGTVASFANVQNTVSNTLSGVQSSAPVANAGPDLVVESAQVVTLDGTGSTAPNATPLTYSWAAPASVTLSDPSAASPTFTAPTLAAGDADIALSFTLTVSDGAASTQDTVLVTVRAGVVVAVNGLPANISGPGSHTVTFTFSRAVTGFTASDIVVSGGSVSRLTGSGTSYSAVIAATGAGDLSVSVPALAAADINGIGNVASGTARAINVLSAATSKEIAHFLQTRTNVLLSNQPDLAGFLRGGAGQFAAEVTRGGGTVAFDSGYNAPIWARLNADWSTDLGAQSQYIFGVIGGHSKLSKNLLLGVMLQFDHLSETNGAATTQGTGWLLGPYFVAKSPNQPLYFQGALLYGQTANTVSPLGTYTDAFSTERWLATLGVTGEFIRGKLTLLPFLDAKYTSDRQAAYVDGLSNPIAAQTIGLAQVSAGLDMEVALNAATTLKAGASGVWSYSSGSAIAPGYQGGRARLSFALTHRFTDCNALELASFYDGIGAADYQSYGASVMWRTCF